MHAVATTTAGSVEALHSYTSPSLAFPESAVGRLHHGFRGLLGVHSCYGLHTCRIACPILLYRRLQQFRYLHHCSDCYRVERTSSRAGFAPTVNQTPFTAHADHAIKFRPFEETYSKRDFRSYPFRGFNERPVSLISFSDIKFDLLDDGCR